jgi:hypothetical protein
MKKWMVVVGVAAVLGAGCASGRRQAGDVERAAYYRQPRTADLLAVRGTNMTITYTGVTEYRVAAMLPTLAPLPREPGIGEKFLDGVIGLGKWRLGWYFGAQVAEKALEQPRTVQPMVVQPAEESGTTPVETGRWVPPWRR